MRSNTITKLIIQTLRDSKTGLVNSEIARKVLYKRPSTTLGSIDSTLSLAAKKGLIDRTPTYGGQGKSKFIYSVEKLPSVISVVRNTVKGSKIDSLEVFMAVRSVLPEVQKTAVDSALSLLVKRGQITHSKNPMTDSNTISSQSKFLYSTK